MASYFRKHLVASENLTTTIAGITESTLIFFRHPCAISVSVWAEKSARTRRACAKNVVSLDVIALSFLRVAAVEGSEDDNDVGGEETAL